MKISNVPADKVFSQYVRLRDKQCMRCYSRVKINPKSGMPRSHHASHFFGRGKESTRFDPENVDTLCHGCHVLWGSRDREDYRAFKIKQLGQTGFDALLVRSNTYQKKDRIISYMQAKALLEEVVGEKTYQVVK